MSHGGHLIRDRIIEKDYVVLNNMANGGPWTWVQRGKEAIRSCLDIAIASRNLISFVKTVIIDKDRQFTPKRVIRKNGEFKSVFTDHFTMEVILADMPKSKVKVNKSSTWNLKRPGGWNAYKDLSDKAAEKIENIVTNDLIYIS